MDSVRQVTIRGTPAAIEAWIQTLDCPIVEGWSRAPGIEERAKGRRNGRWPICLVWSGNGSYPKMAIFLRPVSDAEIGVTTIVALDRGKVAAEDHTAALEAFRTALVTPRGNELHWTDKAASVELPGRISPRAQARFTAFARTANKDMLHSGLDLPRWYDFLIQLRRDGASPPREVLGAALKDESFNPDAVGQLLTAYELTDDILTRYDAFRESE